jgi:hypothetical protein
MCIPGVPATPGGRVKCCNALSSEMITDNGTFHFPVSFSYLWGHHIVFIFLSLYLHEEAA